MRPAEPHLDTAELANGGRAWLALAGFADGASEGVASAPADGGAGSLAAACWPALGAVRRSTVMGGLAKQVAYML